MEDFLEGGKSQRKHKDLPLNNNRIGTTGGTIIRKWNWKKAGLDKIISNMIHALLDVTTVYRLIKIMLC